MTSEQSEAGRAPLLGMKVWDVSGDDILQRIVEAVTRSKEEVELTLQLSGLIVSGVAISSLEYLGRIAAYARETQPPGVSAALTELEALSSAAEAEVLGSRPDFVYMRNAAVFAPGDGMTQVCDLWRGRLAHVSGWAFGVVGGD